MIWDGRCAKHGCEMQAVAVSNLRYRAPLHRCPICCAEFRAAVAKAKACRNPCTKPVKQRVLPPVIMSERWP